MDWAGRGEGGDGVQSVAGSGGERGGYRICAMRLYADGQVEAVSQPYKPGNPIVWTTYTYDELGRVLTVTHPPNTAAQGFGEQDQDVYYANTVKITDPAARWKKYTMDGYGNLTRVDEPKPAGGVWDEDVYLQ